MLGQLLVLAQLAVVCDPADALRPVAEEIARQEGGSVRDGWEGVNSGFAVWVVEPGRLSDRAIVAFATAWRDRFPQTAVGLVVARSPEQARELWRRGRNVHARQAHAFDAAQGVDREHFRTALAAGGYLTFSGHGGERYLRLDDATTMRAPDLPAMPNLVIGTASCNVFRPWAQDSIAMAFLDQGAAAFAGFVYSPEAGFLMGSLPFRYTTPEFPIGRVVQLQNRGAMRAFAALPIYLLAGDPRMALAQTAPFTITSDTAQDGERRLTIDHAPPGTLPVRIPGGAGYQLVETPGASAAQGHGFYNSRLLAMDCGADKFLLVDHAGAGRLTLRLAKTAPWWWPAKTHFLEAMDNALVFFGSGTSTCMVILVVGVVAALVAAACKPNRRAVRLGAGAGLALAALHLAWVMARVPHATVISKPMALNPLAMLATFVLVSATAVLYLTAQGRAGRAGALMLATFPAWFPALLHFGFTAGTNATVFQPRVGAAVYAHHMAALAAWAAPMVAGVVMVAFAVLRRRYRSTDRAQAGAAA